MQNILQKVFSSLQSCCVAECFFLTIPVYPDKINGFDINLFTLFYLLVQPGFLRAIADELFVLTGFIGKEQTAVAAFHEQQKKKSHSHLTQPEYQFWKDILVEKVFFLRPGEVCLWELSHVWSGKLISAILSAGSEGNAFFPPRVPFSAICFEKSRNFGAYVNR